MSSSIEQLRDALELLTTGGNDNGGEKGLGSAVSASYRISDAFNNVNGSLVDGWETAANFFVKIEEGISVLCRELYYSINNYVEETQQLEFQAQQAVFKANETAEQILNELGLNTHDFPTEHIEIAAYK